MQPLSRLEQKHSQRVFTTIRNPTKMELTVVNFKTVAVSHMGVGVPGQGWSRSWAG